MKIFTHNFNPNSNSGPNKFTRDLFKGLQDFNNVSIAQDQISADIEFCLIQQLLEKKKPMALRLDGIYFNTSQDFKSLNAPIKRTYEASDAVIFQSNFNKSLTEHWFGEHKNSFVVHNATSVGKIQNSLFLPGVPEDAEVWCCASSWRPHKRLVENVRYFLEFSPEDSFLAVAGSGVDRPTLEKISDLIRTYRNHRKNILILGDLSYEHLLGLYARSKKMIHLAYLDHCPNVVVDAQALGCEVVCSSTGGTSEILYRGEVISEKDWDYNPIALYEPPLIDFKNISIEKVSRDVDFNKLFKNCVQNYKSIFDSII